MPEPIPPLYEFRCINCESVITVDHRDPTRQVTCYNCNTRQSVPPNAQPARDESDIPRAAGLPLTAPRPTAIPRPSIPTYGFSGFIGGFIVVACLIGAVVSFLLAFTDINRGSLALIGVSIGCLFSTASGLILLCVRDIAINSWHLRHSNIQRPK